MTKFTPEQIQYMAKLKFEFPFFADNVLKIRTKSGKMLPFHLNRAQRYLHEQLEDQMRRRGFVRAVIVKGRQLGATTYTQGRFYHKLLMSDASLRAFILTHAESSSSEVFQMAKNFHMLSDPAPPLDASNGNQLKFTHNKSGYAVGTAGSKEVGRGTTIQLFHGSEVSFWANAENHIAASAQAVADEPGTEMILESTADGIGNVFHRYAMAALRGKSKFEVIFIPWFWGEDYIAHPPKGWHDACPVEWQHYGVDHNLDWNQLYWAFLKNQELATAIGEGDDAPCWKFRQEYPATLAEAFQTSGANAFISPHLVQKARSPDEKVIGRGPVILGIDPSRIKDKTGVIDRCGSRMGERIVELIDPGGDLTYLADKIANIIDRIKPDAVNIDIGGLGAGLFDILQNRGYGRRCQLNPVNFGERPRGNGPTGSKVYANRRAEMYDTMREWFSNPIPVQIPDDDGLQIDLCAPIVGPQATRMNSRNELQIEEKDKIKARIGHSPDLGDAAALTFAVPMEVDTDYHVDDQPRQKKSRSTGY